MSRCKVLAHYTGLLVCELGDRPLCCRSMLISYGLIGAVAKIASKFGEEEREEREEKESRLASGGDLCSKRVGTDFSKQQVVNKGKVYREKCKYAFSFT